MQIIAPAMPGRVGSADESATAAQVKAPPAFADGSRYALLGPRDLGHEGLPIGAKPFACAQLDALARKIHRERRGDALELSPERVSFRGQVRDAVRVVARHPMSGEARLIGHAWINGRDWRVLEVALLAETAGQDLAGAA